MSSLSSHVAENKKKVKYYSVIHTTIKCMDLGSMCIEPESIYSSILSMTLNCTPPFPYILIQISSFCCRFGVLRPACHETKVDNWIKLLKFHENEGALIYTNVNVTHIGTHCTVQILLPVYPPILMPVWRVLFSVTQRNFSWIGKYTFWLKKISQILELP